MNIKNIFFSVILINSMFSGIEISASCYYEKQMKKQERKARQEQALYGEGRVSLKRESGGNFYYLTSYKPSKEDGSCGRYAKKSYRIPAKYPIIIKQTLSDPLSFPSIIINTAEDTFTNLEENGEKFSCRYFSPRTCLGEKTSKRSCNGFFVVIVGDEEYHRDNCRNFEKMFKDFQENQKQSQ